MKFLFGKKEEAQALAEVLEDGREIMNQEMKKPKYNSYKGAEPLLKVKVRVQPTDEPPFEAIMEVGLTHSYLLKSGVVVQVRYTKGKNDRVIFDDNNQIVLQRNANILKKG